VRIDAGPFRELPRAGQRTTRRNAAAVEAGWMTVETRTALLRRRIKLYLRCVRDGINPAQMSEFRREIAAAEGELKTLIAQRPAPRNTAMTRQHNDR
jgi:hypothetical protein